MWTIQQYAVVATEICRDWSAIDLADHAIYPTVDMIDLLAETTNTGIVKIDLLHVGRRDQRGRAVLNDELTLVVEEVDCAAVARAVVDALYEKALAQAFA